MHPYGSIGKINLIPAIGLASNLSSEIDRKSSGCLSCPFYASIIREEKSAADQCATCQKKKIAYQNEKSRYGGVKPSLTKAELLVFMALHMYNPSSTGIVADISVANLATDCHIAQKTSYEVLDNLVSKGYICLDTSTRGSYTALIKDYDKYFVPANKGGRGYVVITKEAFEQFASTGSVNALRFAVRSYINIDMTSKNTPEHNLTHSESIRQALSYLPNYLRPCHLRKIVLEHLPRMFKPVRDISHSIVISLDPAYYGPTVKQNLIGEETDLFRTQLEGVLESIHRHEKGLISTLHLSNLARSAQVALVHLRADTSNLLLQPETLIQTDSNSLLSLAQIAMEYGHDRVLQALIRVWSEWRPGGKDQASYIRTILAS